MEQVGEPAIRQPPRRPFWTALGAVSGLLLVVLASGLPEFLIRQHMHPPPTPPVRPFDLPAADAPARREDLSPPKVTRFANREDSKPLHWVRQFERPPVVTPLRASTHGFDLETAESVGRIALDPSHEYELRTHGQQFFSFSPGTFEPNRSATPAQLKTMARRMAAAAITANGATSPTNQALVALESRSGLVFRLVGPAPITVRDASAAYLFSLTDSESTLFRNDLTLEGKDKQTGASHAAHLDSRTWIDDDQRLLVRSLDPIVKYTLILQNVRENFPALEEPKRSAVCTVSTPDGPGEGRIERRRGASPIGVGTQYALSPGEYAVSGASSLWCTLPWTGDDAGELQLKLLPTPR